MPVDPKTFLTINGGSSSLRFAVYADRDDLPCVLDGKIDRVGHDDAKLAFTDHRHRRDGEEAVAADTPEAAAEALIDWLERVDALATLKAVGHRVVHGMDRVEPCIVDDALLDELQALEIVDPDHLPAELALIRAIGRHRPDWPQVVCFDTAFHRSMPRVATLLPIPRRYASQGLRRYGFHGLSYAYLIEALARVAGDAAAAGRVVIAHLGGGASVTALRDARSVDTSMGFTPTAGLPMGTRSGDLDPGILAYLARREGMTIDRFATMINHESGLLGISETSSDMRDLLAAEHDDERAADAVAAFCYQARKWIGGYAAVLGGLDTLVFSGGIGESAPVIRARICEGLEFLGVRLDATRNDADDDVVSAPDSRVVVRVIATNEQLMIARAVRQLVHDDASSRWNAPRITAGPPRENR